MNRFLVTVAAIVPAITVALAQTTAARPALTPGKPAVPRSAKARTPLVEFEMMTWPEVKQTFVDGKTTAHLLHRWHRAAWAAECQRRPQSHGEGYRQGYRLETGRRHRDASATLYPQ